MTQPPSSPYGSGNDQGGSNDPYGQSQPPQYGGQQQPPAPDPYGQSQPPPYGGEQAQPPYGGEQAPPQYAGQPYTGQPYAGEGSQQYGGGQPYGGQPPKKRGALPWILGGCGVLLLLAIIVVVAVVLVVRGSSPGPGDYDRPDSSNSDYDESLDALWEDCDNGTAEACDDLYFQSDVDSVYEDFGSTCGGRNEATSGGCVQRVGD